MAGIVGLLLQKGVGLLQMPCPELRAAGANRKPMTKEEYEQFGLRAEANKCAVEVADQTVAHLSSDGRVVCVIGIGRSPSCGVVTTTGLDPRQSKRESTTVAGAGLFMESLALELDRRALSVPMLEVPDLFGRDEGCEQWFLRELGGLLDHYQELRQTDSAPAEPPEAWSELAIQWSHALAKRLQIRD